MVFSQKAHIANARNGDLDTLKQKILKLPKNALHVQASV